MIVAELMTPNPVTVAPSDSLELAYERMKTGQFRHLPVMHEGKLIGILTDRDLRQCLGQLGHTSVEAVMSALPFSVGTLYSHRTSGSLSGDEQDGQSPGGREWQARRHHNRHRPASCN